MTLPVGGGVGGTGGCHGEAFFILQVSNLLFLAFLCRYVVF
jgi:hypothetical protein